MCEFFVDWPRELSGLRLVVDACLRGAYIRKELREIRQQGDAFLFQNFAASSGLQLLAGCRPEFRHSYLVTTRRKVVRLAEGCDLNKICPCRGRDDRHFLR